MTNNPIEKHLTAAEGKFEIELLNKVTNAGYPRAEVYPNNTLGQILVEYAVDLGVDPDDSKVNFENKRTGETTPKRDMTVAEFGLQAGDVLVVYDNAGVAEARLRCEDAAPGCAAVAAVYAGGAGGVVGRLPDP